jgi:hypothetical protein
MPKKKRSRADSHARGHVGWKESHIKPTEQELQLIEMIRELEEGNEFQLTVARKRRHAPPFGRPHPPGRS